MIALNVKEKFCKKISGDDLPEFQVSEITLLGKSHFAWKAQRTEFAQVTLLLLLNAPLLFISITTGLF